MKLHMIHMQLQQLHHSILSLVSCVCARVCDVEDLDLDRCEFVHCG